MQRMNLGWSILQHLLPSKCTNSLRNSIMHATQSWIATDSDIVISIEIWYHCFEISTFTHTCCKIRHGIPFRMSALHVSSSFAILFSTSPDWSANAWYIPARAMMTLRSQMYTNITLGSQILTSTSFESILWWVHASSSVKAPSPTPKVYIRNAIVQWRTVKKSNFVKSATQFSQKPDKHNARFSTQTGHYCKHTSSSSIMSLPDITPVESSNGDCAWLFCNKNITRINKLYCEGGLLALSAYTQYKTPALKQKHICWVQA